MPTIHLQQHKGEPVRTRNPLQANDFLYIVDFIKNEEKYSARIKELQDLEASLQLKMQIVNTLEGADALIAKHKITQVAMDVERIAEQKVIKERKEQLEAEFALRNADLEKKMAENRMFHKSVALQMNEVRDTKIALAMERSLLDATKVELGQREKELVQLKTKWTNKVAALQQVLIN